MARGSTAYGYVRLSVETETSTSPERQREILASICTARGWDLRETFEDLDVSGGKERRPGLDALLARLSECDIVVTWKLDRLARSVSHSLKLFDAFERAGVELVCSDGTIDTTSAQGRAMSTMRAVFGQLERDTVSERVKGWRAYRKAQGLPPPGGRPSKLTVPELATLARRVLDDGEPLFRVWESLPLAQRPWNSTDLRRQWQTDRFEAAEPDLAALLRARFGGQTKRSSEGNRTTLLSGLVFCGLCGHSLAGGGQCYRCSKHGGGCGRLRISEGQLDDLVLSRAEGAAAVFTSAPEHTGPDPADLALLRALDEREGVLGIAFAEGRMTPRQVEGATRSLANQRRDVEARIAAALPAGPEPSPDLLHDIRNLPAPDQRALIRAILGRITVAPGTRGRKTMDPARVTFEKGAPWKK